LGRENIDERSFPIGGHARSPPIRPNRLSILLSTPTGWELIADMDGLYHSADSQRSLRNSPFHKTKTFISLKKNTLTVNVARVYFFVI